MLAYFNTTNNTTILIHIQNKLVFRSVHISLSNQSLPRKYFILPPFHSSYENCVAGLHYSLEEVTGIYYTQIQNNCSEHITFI